MMISRVCESVGIRMFASEAAVDTSTVLCATKKGPNAAPHRRRDTLFKVTCTRHRSALSEQTCFADGGFDVCVCVHIYNAALQCAARNPSRPILLRTSEPCLPACPNLWACSPFSTCSENRAQGSPDSSSIHTYTHAHTVHTHPSDHQLQ